jgi:sodium transport system permease protein
LFERLGEERMASQTVKVALDLRGLQADVQDKLRGKLVSSGPIEFVDVDAGALLDFDLSAPAGELERERAAGLLADGHALLVARAGGDGGPPRLARWTRSTDETAMEADRRLAAVLEDLRVEERERRIVEALRLDPGAPFEAQARDVADPAVARGKQLGRWAPLVLLFTLIGSAAWVVLSAFAGEREAGTLETLLVQPVPGRLVAWAKFAVVVAVTLASLGANLLGFQIAVQAGLVSGMAADARAAISPLKSLATMAVFLPCVLLTCSVLCVATARAKTFREGQNLLLPLLLGLLVPMVPLPDADLGLKFAAALLPFAGAALAVREVLGGEPMALLVASCVVSQLAWSFVFVRKVGDLLDGEKALMAGDVEREAQARAVQSRRALHFAVAAMLCIYVLGGILQGLDLALGLAATLWGIALPFAVLSARGTARRAGESLVEVLGLARFPLAGVAGAVLLAPALAKGAELLFALQQRLLPLPSGYDAESLFAEIHSLPTFALLLLVAVSPAICEELLFRGALLSGLRRDLGAAKSIWISAILFGLVHASIYRLAPTTILGALLAALTLSTRSLWPAMALHAAYNAVLVLQGLAGRDGDALVWLPEWSPWLAPIGLALCAWSHARARTR